MPQAGAIEQVISTETSIVWLIEADLRMWKNRGERILRFIMIDADGFRPNVGIVLSNSEGMVFWARRAGKDSWQFPQGGIKREESPEQAMYRDCLLYTSPSPRDQRGSRMPSSA